MNRSRQPKGIPVGGEFATGQRAESDDLPEGPFPEPVGIVTGSSSGMIEQYPHSLPPLPKEIKELPSEVRRADDYRRYKRDEREVRDAKRILELTVERDTLLHPTHRRPRPSKEGQTRLLELTEQISYRKQSALLPRDYRPATSDWVQMLEADLSKELLPMNSRVSVLEVKLLKSRKDKAEIAAIYLRRAEILGIFRAHRDRESLIMEMS